MTSRFQIFFVFLLLFISGKAQKIPTIHVKKTQFVFFFQVGNKTDTISANKGNLFYLLVPDSLKESTVLDVENAQLSPTSNDSIVELKYLPGIRYESYFVPAKNAKNSEVPQFEYKVQVNGSSLLDPKRIKITILDRKTEKVGLEAYYYFTQ